MIIDGGYLTFKLAFGGYDLWEFENGEDIKLLAWDSPSKRKEEFPGYKGHRREGNQEAIERVKEFREYVYETTCLPLCEIKGLEADDIIAAWNIFHPNDRIVGIDKDFFQLPNVFNLYHHNHQPWNFDSCLDKIPLYLQELADRNFALYQMLYGDIADDIPRLLSKHKEGKEQVSLILRHLEGNLLGDLLVKMFDEQIVENAKLVLLPHYSEFSGENWFGSWSTGEYYDSQHWVELYQKVQDSTKPSGFIQMKLW